MGNGELVLKATIPDTATLEQAMVSLKGTGLGLSVVIDRDKKVIGVITDGDIRACLLQSGGLEESVLSFMSRDFVRVSKGVSRETVLKLLDSRIRAIPLIDEEGQLSDIVGTGYDLELVADVSRARAPARISLAGGGTDFTHYFMDHGGAGLTCTVAKYSHAVLRKRNDLEITIFSYDFQKKVRCRKLSDLRYDGTLDLVKAGIILMKPEFGFDLEVGSDFPPASGLGGSAALLSAVIGCFNEFRSHRLDRYAIAEYAFEAERIELKISGGWQDQYSTVFGGFNFLEFNRQHNVVTPLRLEPHLLRELEESFILCHTGSSHLGGILQDKIHERQRDANYEVVSLENRKRLKEITDQMRNRLLRGELTEVGHLIGETWKIKKAVDSQVTSPKLDAIYDSAIKAGATGGRLLGTGGGGYFLFFVPPFKRFPVIQTLKEQGLSPESICFDQEGTSSWKI